MRRTTMALLLCCALLASAPGARGVMRGSFDGFDGTAADCTTTGSLIGWAVDTALPGGGVPPVTVRLTVDGVPVLTVVADQFRPDLVKAGVAPNPKHGFLVNLPPAAVALLAKPGPHKLAAYAVGAAPDAAPARTSAASAPWELPCGGKACAPFKCAAGGGDTYSYVDNGVIRVGVDTTRGGSIGFIAPSAGASDATNIVNCHDMGREIQLSFYGGPKVYDPPTSAYPKGACDKLFGPEWPWNPIGAGDVDGNHGEVLRFTKNATGWNILTRPLQWACHNVSCECTFEQDVQLTGPTIKVVSTLRNSRSDKTVYPAFDQELPAVYTNGPYYHLVSYSGDEPWTGANTTEFVTGFRGPGAKGGAWIPGMFQASERWAALVNDAGFGLGVVNPEVGTFLGGFSGSKGSGGPHDEPTGYIAPVTQVALAADEVYTFVSYMVVGNVSAVRSFARTVVPHPPHGPSPAAGPSMG